MEKTYKRVPFDIELAKKIQAGEIEGKIVYRSSLSNDYKPARIICWNRIPSYPIVALVEIGPYYEAVYFFDKTGKTSDGHHLCIKLPERVKKVRISDAIERIANNFKTKQEGEAFKQGLIFAVGVSAEYRDQLGIYGYEENISTAEVTSKREFKPFDKVLGKSNIGEWVPDIYSRMNATGRYICLGGIYESVIKYAGNEHLAGTTDKPKED